MAKHKGWTKVVAGLLVLATGIGGYAAIARFSSRGYFYPAGNLPKAVADYKAAGLPWKAADLEPNPPISDDENAGPLLQEAGQELDGLSYDSDFKMAADFIDSGEPEKSTVLLKLYAPALTFAKEATKCKGLSFHRNWDQGAGVLFPELSKIKTVVRACNLQAEVEAAKCHGDRSAEGLTTAWRVAHLIGEEPTMISLLVQLAASKMVLASAARCAWLLRNHGDELTTFVGALPFEDDKKDLSHALRGEEFMFLCVCRSPAMRQAALMQSHQQEPVQVPHPTADTISSDGLPGDIVSRALLAQSLRYWTEGAALVKSKPHDPIAATTGLETIFRRVSSEPGPLGSLGGELFPTFSNTGEVMQQEETFNRATRALLAVVAYKKRVGHFPKRLQDVGTWTDPATGKPLAMAILPGSVQVGQEGQVGVKTRPSNAEVVVAAFPPFPREKREG